MQEVVARALLLCVVGSTACVASYATPATPLAQGVHRSTWTLDELATNWRAYMPATPEAQQIMDTIGAAGPPPNTKEAAEARQGASPADAMRQVLEERGTPYEPEPVADISERTIPGPGGEIPVRVYTPEGQGPFPVLVYYHGGGWVLFDLDVYDASCRGLANAGGCVVLSVDYRQAPEHRYPAAHEDTFAAYAWARSHAPEIGGDPGRVGVPRRRRYGRMPWNGYWPYWNKRPRTSSCP